jgi:hypothetical protein
MNENMPMKAVHIYPLLKRKKKLLRSFRVKDATFFFFLNFKFAEWGVESKLGPLGTSATHWRIIPAPGDCEAREFGVMNGRGNRSTRRKPAPTPLCPPQIPLDQTRDWTRAAAVGSQRLPSSAMARPLQYSSSRWEQLEAVGGNCGWIVVNLFTDRPPGSSSHGKMVYSSSITVSNRWQYSMSYDIIVHLWFQPIVFSYVLICDMDCMDPRFLVICESYVISGSMFAVVSSWNFTGYKKICELYLLPKG